jgi:hypothetical protein
LQKIGEIRAHVCSNTLLAFTSGAERGFVDQDAHIHCPKFRLLCQLETYLIVQPVIRVIVFITFAHEADASAPSFRRALGIRASFS